MLDKILAFIATKLAKSTANYSASGLSENLNSATAVLRRAGDTGIIDLSLKTGSTALASGATMSFSLAGLPTLQSPAKGVGYSGKTIFVANINQGKLVTVRMIGDNIGAGTSIVGIYIPVIFA